MEMLSMAFLAAGLGSGVIVFGAAMGIAKLASTAFESMSRQPEVLGDLRVAMIIAAVLIEGVTFFALVIMFLLATKAA
jgi:F-type H+-transporting ATPase subunit c